MYKALIVEKDAFDREEIAGLLKKYEYELVYAQNCEEGWEVFCNHEPDIVVTSYNFPRMNGQVFVDKIKNRIARTGILLFTNHAPEIVLINLMRYERLIMLRKPVDRKRFGKVMGFLKIKPSPYSGPEHRKYRRIPTEMVCTIEGVGPAKVVNLSVGGIYAGTESAVPIGANVTVQLPEISDEPMKGTVVWQVLKEHAGKFPAGIGIHFEETTSDQISSLGRYIYNSLKNTFS